jgi:uncharacterized coiled-coil protein SlyX
MSAEPVPEEMPDADTVDGDLVRDLVVQLNSLQDRVDELEDTVECQADRIDTLESEVEQQDTLIEALRAQNTTIKQALANDPNDVGTWNTERMDGIYPRLVEVEEQLDDHEEKFEMFVVEEGKTATPDERAMHLRQVLYNKAKRVSRQEDAPEDLEVEMDRDECTSALGADLARSSIIDAMKRAADGSDAGNPDAIEYTAIQGSSDLQAVDAIAYHSGRSIGSAGGIAQSTIEMSVSDLTGVEARKIPTTVSGGDGGS